MRRRFWKFARFLRPGIYFAAMIGMSACALPVVAPAPELMSEGQLNTAVARTAAAAQTQTATLLPPSSTPTLTLTSSPTPGPTQTPIQETSTPTPLFAPPVVTIPPTETLAASVEEAGGASADSNSSDGGSFTLSSEQWSCGIVERTTATVKPKEKFSLYVTFRNLGTWSWTSNTIDFVYRNGFRHEGTRIQDLRSTIAPGGTVTIAINYKAPKGGGSYQSFFDLQVGNHTFCGVKVTFEVIEK